MKISDLSRATGVDVETIRYYEKAGLLPAPAREANGYRSYGARTWSAWPSCAIAAPWTCRWPT